MPGTTRRGRTRPGYDWPLTTQELKGALGDAWVPELCVTWYDPEPRVPVDVVRVRWHPEWDFLGESALSLWVYSIEEESVERVREFLLADALPVMSDWVEAALAADPEWQAHRQSLWLTWCEGRGAWKTHTSSRKK